MTSLSFHQLFLSQYLSLLSWIDALPTRKYWSGDGRATSTLIGLAAESILVFGAVRFSQDFSCKNFHARQILRYLAKVLPKLQSFAKHAVLFTQDLTRILVDL